MVATLDFAAGHGGWTEQVCDSLVLSSANSIIQLGRCYLLVPSLGSLKLLFIPIIDF